MIKFQYTARMPITYGGEPIVTLQEGPGVTCGPIGRRYFDKKEHLIFWEDGSTTDLRQEPFPYFLSTDYRTENEKVRYSEWTAEQRKTERDRREAERIAEEEKAMFEQNKHDALLASARSKLTQEEYDAVYNEGYESGRDY